MKYEFANNAGWTEAKAQLTKRWVESDSISVLDIGCNEGDFLRNLPAGWRRYGIEGGEEPAINAKKHDIDIIADRLQSVNSKWKGYFHAVTLFDVVEHLTNPAEGLRQAAELLRPGGILIVSTGDMDAWTWRWFRGSHWYLQTPLHLSFASQRFFNYVAKTNDWKVIQHKAIPHQLGTAELCWQDRVEALYFGARRRGGLWRILQRLIHLVPDWQHLRHRTSVPWTFHVRDHIVVTYQP